MKRLHEAVQEAKRLSEPQSLDGEWLESMTRTVQQLALHGNQTTREVLDALFPREEPTACDVCRAEAAGIKPCENCGTPVCPECVRSIGPGGNDDGCSSCS